MRPHQNERKGRSIARRHGRHRNEVQEPVQAEDEKHQPQKNARDDHHNFHWLLRSIHGRIVVTTADAALFSLVRIFYGTAVPPATAPRIMKGSVPFVTASGRGVSGGS